jgi:hypothetical protein
MDIELKVRSDSFTWGDLKTLDRSANVICKCGETYAGETCPKCGAPRKEATAAVKLNEITEIFDRAIEGGIDKLPIAALPEMIAALRKSIEATFASVPGTAAGN